MKSPRARPRRPPRRTARARRAGVRSREPASYPAPRRLVLRRGQPHEPGAPSGDTPSPYRPASWTREESPRPSVDDRPLPLPHPGSGGAARHSRLGGGGDGVGKRFAARRALVPGPRRDEPGVSIPGPDPGACRGGRPAPTARRDGRGDAGNGRGPWAARRNRPPRAPMSLAWRPALGTGRGGREARAAKAGDAQAGCKRPAHTLLPSPALPPVLRGPGSSREARRGSAAKAS